MILGQYKSVLSRTDKVHQNIKGQLLPPEEIIRNIDTVIKDQKTIVQRQRNDPKASLFTKESDFNECWTRQKENIRKFVKDVVIAGKHYFEAADGHFYVYRGTNRNESLHRKMNQIFPEKCGIEVADAVIDFQVMQFNAQRALYIDKYSNVLQDEVVPIQSDLSRIHEISSSSNTFPTSTSNSALIIQRSDDSLVSQIPVNDIVSSSSSTTSATFQASTESMTAFSFESMESNDSEEDINEIDEENDDMDNR